MPTDHQLNLVRHMLGLPDPPDPDRLRPPAPCRNYFALYPECDGIDDMAALEAEGLVIRRIPAPEIFGDLIYFHATAAGFAAVGAEPNDDAKAAGARVHA